MVFALGLLIRVGVGAHRDVVPLPPSRRELRLEPLDGVHLDDDAAVEVLAHTETEVLVSRASEAIGARVAATSVRVDREAKRDPAHLRHPIHHRACVDVEELHAAELALPDMTLDDGVVREQLGLVLLGGESPAERRGLDRVPHAGQYSERLFVIAQGSALPAVGQQHERSPADGRLRVAERETGGRVRAGDSAYGGDSGGQLRCLPGLALVGRRR